MCDGASVNQGALKLCTDGFTVPCVCRLMNVLTIRYGLNCTLQYYAGKPRIYIPARDLRRLQLIVEPYMHSLSMYKLSAGKIKRGA